MHSLFEMHPRLFTILQVLFFHPEFWRFSKIENKLNPEMKA